MIPVEAALLRIYVNAGDHWRGGPLYRAIVEAARAGALAGASVFPAELGFGAHRLVHDVASDYTSFDIPVVVEIVDALERLALFRGELAVMIGEGLGALRPARVVRYGIPAADQAGGLRGRAGVRPQPGDSTRQGASSMPIEGEAERVTVYVGSSDTWHGRNLAVAIVECCRELGLAGATVSRGVMGFGKQSVIHRAHLLGLSEDLPERVEVVDRPEQVARLLPVLDEMVGGGLIVVEDVRVVRYLHQPQDPRTTAP